jgi:YD repeat-containing protein
MRKHPNLPWKAALLFFLLLFSTQPAAATTLQYTYDNMGRLLKADFGGGRSLSYTYDLNGNFLTRTAMAEIIRGDVNIDGTINLMDALVTLRVLSGQNVPSETFSDYVASRGGAASPLGLSEVLYILQDIAQLR